MTIEKMLQDLHDMAARNTATPPQAKPRRLIAKAK